MQENIDYMRNLCLIQAKQQKICDNSAKLVKFSCVKMFTPSTWVRNGSITIINY